MASFCEHCQGQRFDRALVLRALRQMQQDLRHSRSGTSGDAVIGRALRTVLALEIPHLAPEEDEDQVVH